MSLFELALMFVRFGLLSIGGNLAIIAEMRREIVDVYGIMSDLDFSTAYGIAQATPGPNILYLVPIGYHAAGAAGAIVAFVAYLAPTMLLLVIASRQWDRISHWPWVQVVNAAVAPVCVGLVAAGVATIAAPLRGDWVGIAGAMVATVLIGRLRVNPAFVVLGYAALWAVVPL